MAGLVRPELLPAVKPAPFGQNSHLFDLFARTPPAMDAKGNIIGKDPIWLGPETNQTQAIYDDWLRRFDTDSPHVKVCRAFGFNVDVPPVLARGFGKAWQKDYVRALDIKGAQYWSPLNRDVPGYMHLALRYRVARDWYQWGPAHLADSLAAFCYPPAGCEAVKQDLLEGRLEFKYSWSGSRAYMSVPASPNPDTGSGLVENTGRFGFYPSAVAPTDHSLDVLLGRSPGPDGTSRVSVQTLALLILTGSLCWTSENGDTFDYSGRTDPVYYYYQLAKIYKSNVFSDASFRNWWALYQKTADAWGKAFNQILPDLSGFTSAFNKWLAGFAATEKLFALAVTVGVRMTVLIGTIGVTLFAPQIGIPAVASIAAGLKVASAAALGERVDWVGTAVSVGAAVGVGAALEGLAGDIGVSKDTITTVAAAPETAKAALTDSLGVDNFSQEDTMDIFGFNIDVDPGRALDSVAQSIGSAIGPVDNPLADFVPEGVTDALAGLASSVTVAPKPQAAPPAPIKPVSSPQVLPKASGAVWPLLLLAGGAYFFYFKKAG